MTLTTEHPQKDQARPAWPSDYDVVAAARGLGARISAHSERYERERTIGMDTAELMRSAGLFSVSLPAALGGLEAPPTAMVEVIEAISAADGSAGWTLMVGQGAGFLGWASKECGEAVVAATPDPIVACSLAPMGAGRVPVGAVRGREDEFTLSGNWTFNSGCRQADWYVMAFMIERPEDVGKPVSWGHDTVRFAVVPADEVRINDSWHVMGLKGTGSEDVTITDVVVPRARTFSPFFEKPGHAGPLYRFSYFSYMMTMMAGYQLGLGRRVIDEFSRYIGAGTQTDDDIDVALLRAEAALGAARLLMFDAVTALWDQVCSGAAADPVLRARISAACQHAHRTADELIDDLLRRCGPDVMQQDHVLQRCWRDMKASAAHIAYSLATERRMARAAVGREQRTLHLV